MFYVDNAESVKKGKLGELAVAQVLGKYYVIERPEDIAPSGASVVDFVLKTKSGNITCFAEVKTRVAFHYGATLSYSLSQQQIDRYRAYQEKHGVPIEIWIVDPKENAILWQSLDSLETSQPIDGYTFPVIAENSTLGGLWHYWNRKQFNKYGVIPCDILNELRLLFKLDEESPNIQSSLFGQDEKQANNQSESLPAIKDIVVAPNGTAIDVLEIDDVLFVRVGALCAAIGYKAPSYSNTSHIGLAVERTQTKMTKINVPVRQDGTIYLREAFIVEVTAVPKILDAFTELTYSTVEQSKKFKFHEQAKKLLAWFTTTVLPKYEVKPVNPDTAIDFDPKCLIGAHATPSQPADTLKEPTEKELVEKFSATFGIDKAATIQFILDARQKEFELRQKEFKELIL